MRRAIIAVLVAGSLSAGGAALASPPDSDPTCRDGQTESCPGDNGNRGCEGIDRARATPADEQAPDAFDLITDILSPGADGECD